VRDDEIRRIATDANPWWRAKASAADPVAWTAANRLLRDRGTHDLGYRAGELDDIARSPISDALVVLAGPRRIGKSVALLDLAATLCARGDVDPRQIIHLPCDGLRDRDLRRALTLARELTRSVDIDDPPRRRVWLLDEITGIAGWTSVLKAARDNTPFGDDTVVSSGSRWIGSDDALGSLLAGRAGTTDARRVRLLLPMTFGDFLRATRPDLPRLASVHPSDLQLPNVGAALEAVRFDIDSYDLAWQDFLSCGGFPRAVAEHARTGAVSLPYLRDLEAWIRSDVDPDASPDSAPILLAGLAERAASPLNTTKTALALGYANRQNFDRRLARLVATFAAVACPRRRDDGRVVTGSQAKCYLTDPLLALLPSRLRAGLAAPDSTRLTEMALGVALARSIDRLDEGRWVTGDTIGYRRTASGNEIDLAPVQVPTASTPAATVPIEAKWIDHGWRAEAKVVEGRYGRGIVATKSLLDVGTPAWAVPAPLVALLLN
jgi:uncharacterized protein